MDNPFDVSLRFYEMLRDNYHQVAGLQIEHGISFGCDKKVVNFFVDDHPRFAIIQIA